jgi:uncharacterized protein YbjQ (UPF0145 family)
VSAADVPPHARERLAGSAWTSTLSVQEHAAVRGVGFEPVGQVMGSTVDLLSYDGIGGCGSALGQPSRVAGTGSVAGSSWSGYAVRVRALYAARRRAMARLEAECRLLGADGVVGVTLTHAPFPGLKASWEFRATGTAVRSRGREHPARPFMTALSGQDFSALLRAHWVPCGLVMGVAIGVRHYTVASFNSTRKWTTAEVPGYTQLVEHTRAQVRKELSGDAQRQGAAGVVLQEMELHVSERPCTSLGGEDNVAEATLLGTAITPFRHSAEPPAAVLQVLRLDELHQRVRGTTLVDDDEESPWQS